jgi:hypothetical protein
MWSVCIPKLCQPRTEADGKPVTESNLSLRAFAQVAADMLGCWLGAGLKSGRPDLDILRAASGKAIVFASCFLAGPPGWLLVV